MIDLTVKAPAGAYIAGRYVPARDGATFDSLNPATGTVLARLAACGESDVDAAVRSARETFESGSWSRLAPSERKSRLQTFANLLEENLRELAELESVDAGKPITDCLDGDLPETIATIRWYAEAIDKVFGKTSPAGHGALGLIEREPIGVVGAVLPWNFPAMTLSWKIGPALAAGNSVVVKPAEQASLSTLRIAELAVDSGIPAGALNVVTGLGHEAGRAIGLHPEIDVVTFTGSAAVGREFLRYSADSNMKQIVLECGGKSPQVVTADCAGDLEAIAEDLAQAAFWNAGQNCTAGSRILVHSSIKDDFVTLLAERARSRTVGDPSDPATAIGPLIEPDALDRVSRYVDEAKMQGVAIAAGGARILEETGGWYYPPTILNEVRTDMPVAREELFGPVVSVLTFDTLEEALHIANDTVYGLAATVWSRNMGDAFTLARGIRAGTVGVNGYSEGDITTPFGGYRQSGFGGRDNGLEAFDQYTELKTIWVTLK